MVDAVSAVVSSTPVLRQPAEEATSQNSAVVAEVRDVGSVAASPQAPFISPFIAIDDSSNQAVILIRDSDTGDVVRQFPSEGSLRARQSAAAFAAQGESRAVSSPDTSDVADTSTDGGEIGVSTVDVGQAQQAAAALSTAAATQTSEIAQSIVSLSA